MQAYGVTVETDLSEGSTLPIPGLGYYTKLFLRKDTPKNILLAAEPKAQVPQVPQVPRAIFWVDEGGQNHIDTFGLDAPVIRTIPIQSGGRDGNRARTNINAEGSFDILTFTGDGYFTQAEYALRGWGGGLSLTAQIIWAGWALGNELFIPSRPCYAYPGADYTKMWRGMAEAVQKFMEEHNIAFASRARGAEWNPPTVPKQETWRSGVVKFSNLATGVFYVYDLETGMTYPGYHTNIVGGGKGPYQMPPAMSAVHFRPTTPTEPGEAPKVKSCKLA